MDVQHLADRLMVYAVCDQLCSTLHATTQVKARVARGEGGKGPVTGHGVASAMGCHTSGCNMLEHAQKAVQCHLKPHHKHRV